MTHFLHQLMQALRPKLTKHTLVGFLITLLFISLQLFPPKNFYLFNERLEGMAYDTRLLFTLPEAPREYDEKVVIIDIDEKSMLEQGRFPWSRIKLALLVDNLIAAGVVVTAFDIFFAEPQVNPIDEIEQQVPQFLSLLENEKKHIKDQVDADLQFARTLEGSDVVLGFLLNNTQLKRVSSDTKTSVMWREEQQRNSPIRPFRSIIGNIDILENAANGSGFINAHPDSDGFIRKTSLVNRVGDTLYPSLALEAARLYMLADTVETKSNKLTDLTMLSGIKLLHTLIPTNEYGQIYIPYKGPAHSYPYYSATDVITGKINKNELAGKVAFIGTSAIGLADLRATPVGLQYPGVEIHANVFEALMHPEIIPYKPNWSLGASLLIMLVTGIIVCLFLQRQNPYLLVTIAILLIGLQVIFNVAMWQIEKITMPLFMPIFLIVILSSYFVVSGFIIETKNRRSIKMMFDQYVPPDHIERLIRDKGKVTSQSERRNMSVLFADICDFTRLSEELSAVELSQYLNSYLSGITKVVFQHNGTIDKYVGDMVMAFWNAPLPDDLHPQHSVETALAMIAALTPINQGFAKQNLPPIKLGIGINTGDMIVGDMGSQYRKAYTVLGDAVNLGARIESLTRFYGVDILVNESTKMQTPNIAYRQIDRVKVKGKQTTTQIYEPIASFNQLNLDQINALEQHNNAMTLFYQQKWSQSLKIFKELSQKATFSPFLYDIFIQRIQRQDWSIIDPSWDGTYTHTSK